MLEPQVLGWRGGNQYFSWTLSLLLPLDTLKVGLALKWPLGFSPSDTFKRSRKDVLKVSASCVAWWKYLNFAPSSSPFQLYKTIYRNLLWEFNVVPQCHEFVKILDVEVLFLEGPMVCFCTWAERDALSAEYISPTLMLCGSWHLCVVYGRYSGK